MHILVLLVYIELVETYTHASGPYYFDLMHIFMLQVHTDQASRPNPKSCGRERFGWLRVWASEEREWRNEILNLASKFSNMFFALICKIQAVCAREEAEVCWQLACSFSISPSRTKSPRRGSWSTTMTDTSRHRETSRTVPVGTASRTVKLCRPSAPVV